MELVGVLDLMNGCVVRARRGERDAYRPLESRLCRSADPCELAAVLVGGFGLRRLYVADLDAIRGRGHNRAALRALRTAQPDTEIWVDGGIADASQWQEAVALGCGVPVIGSESLADAAQFEAIARAGAEVLSLDFIGARLLGPPEVFARADLWPARVIAMNLRRVGAQEGPDLALLADVRARAPGRSVYVAGGVRDRADLEALLQAGAAGVLLASAFHDGTLTAADIAACL
jgi:phosphoribosylformimino-5-aminoimidazole carboxamide ribotide isomerase